ncbi:MAG: asparagine synthase C-terminal domain-containing protein [Nitrososphaerales archaeon]
MDLEISKQIVEGLDSVAKKVVRDTVRDGSFLLYSGGVDSSILATLGVKVSKDLKLFTLGARDSQDIKNSEQALDLDFSNLPLVQEVFEDEDILKSVERVKSLDLATFSHFEDCVAFALIFQKISAISKTTVTLVSANGPDELFCGYDRFRRIVDTEGYESANKEILKSLNLARDLQRNVARLATSFGLKTAEPFLESSFVDYCLNSVPIELKILKGNDMLRKRAWREYGRFLGLPSVVTNRPKKAMQYSTGLHRKILNMIKNNDSFKTSIRPLTK